jgi:hypothetical protein
MFTTGPMSNEESVFLHQPSGDRSIIMARSFFQAVKAPNMKEETIKWLLTTHLLWMILGTIRFYHHYYIWSVYDVKKIIAAVKRSACSQIVVSLVACSQHPRDTLLAACTGSLLSNI